MSRMMMRFNSRFLVSPLRPTIGNSDIWYLRTISTFSRRAVPSARVHEHLPTGARDVQRTRGLLFVPWICVGPPPGSDIRDPVDQRGPHLWTKCAHTRFVLSPLYFEHPCPREEQEEERAWL